MKLSLVKGPTDAPLLETAIGDALDRAAERWGDQEALVVVHQGIRWTWSELRERVDTFARGLIALGFRPGDRLGIWATNRWEWIVTQLATARIGVILVNINPAYRPGELEYALNKVGCKGLVTGVSFKDVQLHRHVERVDAGTGRFRAGRGSIATRALPDHRDPPGSRDDPGHVQFQRRCGA